MTLFLGAKIYARNADTPDGTVEQKQAAAICERSHVYANCEEVRAIVEMPLPGEDVQEAEEEHMKDLCNKYGIAYDDGVKRRRVPPVPSLSVKYDADARQLHVAVCWKAGVFSDVRALVEETVPGAARPLAVVLGLLVVALGAALVKAPVRTVPVKQGTVVALPRLVVLAAANA